MTHAKGVFYAESRDPILIAAIEAEEIDPLIILYTYVQGDTSHWSKTPVDIKTEVPF